MTRWGKEKKKTQADNTKSKLEETLKAKNLFPSRGAKGGESEQPFPQWRAGSGGGGDFPGKELGRGGHADRFRINKSVAFQELPHRNKMGCCLPGPERFI